MRNLNFKTMVFVFVLFFVTGNLVFAAQAPKQNPPAAAPPAAPPADAAANAQMNQILDRIIGREAILVAQMKNMHPLVETYLQSLDKDDNLAFRPAGDEYFLGKLDFASENKEHSLLKGESVAGKITGKFTQIYSVKYLAGGFAQMLVVNGHFDKKNS